MQAFEISKQVKDSPSISIDTMSSISSVSAGQSSPKSAKIKRRKVSKACSYCRASKVSCDSGRPCSRCLKKGLECVDEETAYSITIRSKQEQKRLERLKSLQEIENIEKRKTLEKLAIAGFENIQINENSVSATEIVNFPIQNNFVSNLQNSSLSQNKENSFLLSNNNNNNSDDQIDFFSIFQNKSELPMDDPTSVFQYLDSYPQPPQTFAQQATLPNCFEQVIDIEDFFPPSNHQRD